jgi:GGDEF domain-containing protein
MPIAATSVADGVVNTLTSEAVDAITLLPTRAALLDRLAELTPSAEHSPATLVLVGLVRRDTAWPMPGSQLDQVASALAACMREGDWLARSGPNEFAVLLRSSADQAETATHRLLVAVAGAGVPGLTARAGIAALAGDTAPTEVHRRASDCLTAARAVGGRQVLRSSDARR